MSMNKVIHAAFRRDLDRFLGALSRFPDGDAARAQALGRAWDNFDFQLTKHHEGEHEIAWPALVQVGVTQQMIDQMDAEHEVMAERLSAARSSMAALRATPTAANAQTAHTAMGELKTVTVEHLDHEERELEAFYVQNADHPEVRAMEGEFRKQSPAFGGRFFAWLTDGITPDARAAIPVPGVVFAILTGVFGRGYRREVAPVWR